MNFASLLLSPGFFSESSWKNEGLPKLAFDEGINIRFGKKSYKNEEKNANKILRMRIFLEQKRSFWA